MRFDLSVVFVVAAVIRLAVAASLWNLPLVRTPKLDSFELLAWAQRLASGDWAWPVVAQHAPGYPVFLAALLTLGSGSLKVVAVAQALVGGGTAVAVACAARRWFGARAGLCAGLAYAVYGPLAYVDTALLSEGLLLFLLALGLWAIAGRLTIEWAAVAGALFAAASLVRPTALLIAAVLGAWVFIVQRRSIAAAYVIAGLVVLLPAVAVNLSMSGTIALQGYGGLNTYIGDSPAHDGRATFRLGAGWDALNSEAARAGIRDPAAQDRYYIAKTWHEVAAQPLAFGRLIVVKALWLVQSEESRDSHSFYFFAEQSPLLRVLPRWWLLFPLAVVGVVLRWADQGSDPGSDQGSDPGSGRGSDPGSDPGSGRGSDQGSDPGSGRGSDPGPDPRSARSGAVPYLYLAAAAATAVFLVVGFRYRMPFVLGLTLFAGPGLDRVISLYSAYSARAAPRLAIAGAAFVAALSLSFVMHDPRNTNLAEEYAFTGSSLITEHRLDEAAAAYRRALELDPQSGLAWDGLGLTQLNANRPGDARAAFERAAAIDADSSRAIYHLALVDDREGRLVQAAAGYERALALSPWDADVTSDLVSVRRKIATELAMSGRTREARETMQRAVELAPHNGDAWVDMSLLSLDLNDLPGATSALQHARESGADPQKVSFAADALARASRNSGARRQ